MKPIVLVNGEEIFDCHICTSLAYTVLGEEVSWYLTSATLHSQVLQDTLCIIGLHQNTMLYCHSNDRPNIHLCVRKMMYPLASHFDLASLILLNPLIDN